MTPFDDTGVTLTTDELAALQTGYPAGPDAEKRAEPAFFAFMFWRFVITAVLLLGMLIPSQGSRIECQPSSSTSFPSLS
ncbi:MULTISPECIES: hypothetical protein [unclassified Rhizobium]|uniref:hypothetical protein n=1 Tax=unclassified Rhizobium TaxID=2613769 RepID=UPI0012EBB930|nr:MULTISPECIES: hypothetical protein [unclassified Rhizobium]MBD9445608.1 hypothetical protein [Rhizobium sp. RHZ01]